jgi:hypothetical protein
MSRRKSPSVSLSPDEISQSIYPEIVFKRISGGFYCAIRPDLFNGVPPLQLNLSSVDAIEDFDYLDDNGLSCSGKRIRCSGGTVYELKSTGQKIDLLAGLKALREFLIKGKIS